MIENLKLTTKRLDVAALGSVLALGMAASSGTAETVEEADGVLSSDVVFWSSYTQGPAPSGSRRWRTGSWKRTPR